MEVWILYSSILIDSNPIVLDFSVMCDYASDLSLCVSGKGEELRIEKNPDLYYFDV